MRNVWFAMLFVFFYTQAFGWLSHVKMRCNGKPCLISNQLQSSLKEPVSDSESIQNEIDNMRKEAAIRFRKLSIQVEEVKKQKRCSQTPESKSNENSKSTGSFEGDISRQQTELLAMEDALRTKSIQQSHDDIKIMPHALDLIDGTRWKIVFNIGREIGTWMPHGWGVSGDRLLFQVEVDFTSTSLSDRDEFFQGAHGVKQLNVVDAFVIPRGVGHNSIGRRPLLCRPTGGFKVCQGQGPMGTDVVRLFIELTDDVIIPESDVFCPKGRVYATCGYFVIHDSREKAAANQKSLKEIAQQEHRDALYNHEQLQVKLDSDTRMFSVEKLKTVKDLYVAKNRVEESLKLLQRARQMEPDKSQLRLSKKADVGLSKDGGVCCKVQKGVAFEYHILGRIEVGCVNTNANNCNIGVNEHNTI